MKNEPIYTKDGFEITMAASFFGHFLMTELLLDTLKATPEARMIILSSVVHAGNPKNRYQVHLDDLHWKNRKYNNFAAYGEANTASVQYAMELAKRLEGTGVTTYSIHPGWARSNFGKGGGAFMDSLLAMLTPVFSALGFSDSSWESAQTSLHCLLSDDVANTAVNTSVSTVSFTGIRNVRRGLANEVAKPACERYGGREETRCHSTSFSRPI